MRYISLDTVYIHILNKFIMLIEPNTVYHCPMNEGNEVLEVLQAWKSGETQEERRLVEMAADSYEYDKYNSRLINTVIRDGQAVRIDGQDPRGWNGMHGAAGMEDGMVAAGVLIMTLVREGVIQEDESGIVKLSLLQATSIDGHVMVDIETLESLGLYGKGHTIFELCNTCTTIPGRNLLRSWFLCPISDGEMLQFRLDAVQMLLERKAVRHGMQKILAKGLGDPASTLTKMQKLQTLPMVKHFLDIQKSIKVMLTLRSFVEAEVPSLMGVQKRDLGQLISEKISDELFECTQR